MVVEKHFTQAFQSDMPTSFKNVKSVLNSNVFCLFLYNPLGIQKMELVSIVIAIVLVGFIFHAMGFRAGGILLGSFAAWWQSMIGNVVAGTLFPLIQSVAALYWSRIFGPPGIAIALVFVIALWNGYLW